MTDEKYIHRLLRSMAVMGLSAFMLLVFLPAETFFANSTELPFVYGDYSGYLWIAAIILFVAGSVITAILPGRAHSLVLSLVFALDVCAYVQNMFLNRGLDLMGLNPDGYDAGTSKIVSNSLIWAVILLIVIILGMLKGLGRKAVTYGALFLLAIQLLAYISLLISADESCYHYPQAEYHLTGEDQYKLSKDGNIVLFVIDSFSNRDLLNALDVDSDALTGLEDFTYYTNMDCCYCGTYPSLTHMLTDNYVDLNAGVNAWTAAAWQDENCNSFYEGIKNAGYRCLLYTPDLHIICGNNEPEDLLAGKWDNFTNAPLQRDIANRKIVTVMVKMAAYRMLPEAMKNLAYVDLSEYSDVVTVIENPIMHENYDFVYRLEETGLSADRGEKVFVVQHLMGTHLFKNDRYGRYKEDASYEETALGCLYMVGEYIRQMKEAGVYDNSTVIITADHGWEYGQQPVFFIKEAGVTSDDMKENNAPVSFHELLPTLAKNAGITMLQGGDTIYDHAPGELRERTLYIRNYMEDYPDVPYFGGGRIGTANVYVGYTYTGDEDDLKEYLFDKPSAIIPMIDSFF